MNDTSLRQLLLEIEEERARHNRIMESFTMMLRTVLGDVRPSEKIVEFKSRDGKRGKIK